MDDFTTLLAGLLAQWCRFAFLILGPVGYVYRPHRAPNIISDLALGAKLGTCWPHVCLCWAVFGPYEGQPCSFQRASKIQALLMNKRSLSPHIVSGLSMLNPVPLARADYITIASELRGMNAMEVVAWAWLTWLSVFVESPNGCVHKRCISKTGGFLMDYGH